MKKTIEEFYREIGEILETEFPELFVEFEGRVSENEAKFVFLWLNQVLQDRTVPKKLNDLMADFYFSIH